MREGGRKGVREEGGAVERRNPDSYFTLYNIAV